VAVEEGTDDTEALRDVAALMTRSLDEEAAADRAALDLCRRAGFGDSGAREALGLLAAVEEEERVRESRRAVPGAVTTLEVVLSRIGIARSIAARAAGLWGLVPARPAVPGARGLAATGMVAACAECCARFPRLGRCPLCGSRAVVALGEAQLFHAPRSGPRGALVALGSVPVVASLFAFSWMPMILGLWLLAVALTRREPPEPRPIRRLRPVAAGPAIAPP